MDRIRREKKKKFISAILVISVCICGVAIFPGADARAITLEEVRAQRELLQQQKAENDRQISSLTKDKQNLQNA